MNTTRRVLLWLVAGYFAVALLGKCTPRDDTDPPGERSGLGLYRDHATGCEYLSAGPFGGITPRVDAAGEHVCHPTTQEQE